MSINLNSIDDCKAAWINYTYEKNTSQVSQSDIKAIEQKYQVQLKEWKVEYSEDQNEYDFDFDNDNDSATSFAVNVGTSVGSAVATNVANTAAINGIVNAGGNFVNSAGQSVATPAGSILGTNTFRAADPASEAAASLTKEANNTAAFGFILATTLGLATGIAYEARDPNKDNYDKLMTLKGEMDEYLSTLENTEDTIDGDSAKLEALSEESQDISEKSEDEINQLQIEYEEKVSHKEVIDNKIKSGKALTIEEKSESVKLSDEITAIGAEITNVSETSSEGITLLNDQCDDVQGDIENATNVVADIQEVTDLAESFDKQARNMAIIESAAQGLNVVSSTKGAINAFSFAASGAALFGSTLWANAFGAMGVTGAALSAKGVVEQALYASDITKEIGIREKVQSMNKEVNELVDNTEQEKDVVLDNIAESVDGLENVANDIETQKEVSITLKHPTIKPEKKEDLIKKDKEPTE